MARTTSRLKEINPTSDPSYWAESPPDNFTDTFILLSAKQDRPSLPVGRPPRTDHYREVEYWNHQLFREVTFRESSSVNSIFEDPQYWASGRYRPIISEHN